MINVENLTDRVRALEEYTNRLAEKVRELEKKIFILARSE